MNRGTSDERWSESMTTTSTKFDIDNKFTMIMTNTGKTLHGETETDAERELGRHILPGPKPESPKHCSETENGEQNTCISEVGESSVAKIRRYIALAGMQEWGGGSSPSHFGDI